MNSQRLEFGEWVRAEYDRMTRAADVESASNAGAYYCGRESALADLLACGAVAPVSFPHGVLDWLDGELRYATMAADLEDEDPEGGDFYTGREAALKDARERLGEVLDTDPQGD